MLSVMVYAKNDSGTKSKFKRKRNGCISTHKTTKQRRWKMIFWHLKCNVRLYSSMNKTHQPPRSSVRPTLHSALFFFRFFLYTCIRVNHSQKCENHWKSSCSMVYLFFSVFYGKLRVLFLNFHFGHKFNEIGKGPNDLKLHSIWTH